MVMSILGHPTGRIIGKREPYDIDMEEVMEAVKKFGFALELNAQPDRLDLNDIYCKMAKDIGVLVVISTDAHSVEELNFMRFGVWQGRRGWLEPNDVLNTMNKAKLKKILF